MMPRDTEHHEKASGLNESRAHPRVKVHSLAYVELGEGNAGLILNISEAGMAVQAVQMLNADYLPSMQFRLPRTDTLIETPGKMIWQIRSKKEAGIEFVRLSDTARQTIRKWIAEERSRQGDAAGLQASDSAAKGNEPAQEREITRVNEFARAAARKDTSAAFKSGAPRAPGPDAGQPNGNSRPADRHSAPHPTPRERPSVQPIRRGVPARWRSGPGNSAGVGTEDGSEFPGHPYPERIPAMPQWNAYMAPGVGMEFKKRRPWWTYTAAIGILAAIGFAALMMFNPDAITRARVDTLVHTPSASPDNNQPADQNNPNQPNSPEANANGASSSNGQTASPTQPPPLPQTPSSSNAGQGQTQAQPDSSQKQSNVPPFDSSASRRQTNSTAAGRQQDSRAANQTSRYQRYAQTAPRQNGNREYADRAQNERDNPSYSRYSPGPAGRSAAPSSAQPARSPSSSYGNPPPANNQTQPYATGASNSRAQQASQSPANDRNPVETYRAQTAAPSGSNPTTSGTNQPAGQQNPGAFQHSNPQYATAPQANANVSRPAAPEPQVAVVEMSGYQSVAVRTSMPLSGVPSGSVAATSQFHAIRVPSSLEWARQFLPGNLGIGRLLSSYSPAYPPEAAREGIQGSVKLDVIVGSDGTVRSVSVLSGPPMLSHAAVSAVRDWRYAETFLAGQSIETEQYVVMVFRLASGN